MESNDINLDSQFRYRLATDWIFLVQLNHSTQMQLEMFIRMRGDMIETYKIIKGIYDKESALFLKMWTDIAQRDIGRGHGMRLYLQRSIKPVRKNSFGVRIVNMWNNLSENVVNSPNVNTFKKRLDKHWENQEILFNYRAELKLNV